MHAANRRHWDAVAEGWRQLRDRDQIWRKCPTQPELAFDGAALEMIRRFGGDLAGQRVCVIGSGDNYAAFALAGMGANVTSVDISERQLQVAAARADELGLRITFVQSDAADMSAIADESFDLLCSSNGFFVWIAQPGRVFSEVQRVLRRGGYYIFYDIHPFMRPWKDQVLPLEMEKPYFETGPFVELEEGQPVYEFTWTLSDLVNPLLAAGLHLCQIAESAARDSRFWQGYAYTPGSDDALLGWHHNPRAGLPVWLTVVAQKPR
jgi:SAM-dependent methyltransferase